MKNILVGSDPILWYNKNFCEKCKTKSCQPKGMVYNIDPSNKLACILALNVMLNIDRGLVENINKKTAKTE